MWRNLERRIRSIEERTRLTPVELAKARILEIFTRAWECKVGLVPRTDCTEINPPLQPPSEEAARRIVALFREAASRTEPLPGIRIACERMQRFLRGPEVRALLRGDDS